MSFNISISMETGKVQNKKELEELYYKPPDTIPKEPTGEKSNQVFPYVSVTPTNLYLVLLLFFHELKTLISPVSGECVLCFYLFQKLGEKTVIFMYFKHGKNMFPFVTVYFKILGKNMFSLFYIYFKILKNVFIFFILFSFHYFFLSVSVI